MKTRHFIQMIYTNNVSDLIAPCRHALVFCAAHKLYYASVDITNCFFFCYLTFDCLGILVHKHLRISTSPFAKITTQVPTAVQRRVSSARLL